MLASHDALKLRHINSSALLNDKFDTLGVGVHHIEDQFAVTSDLMASSSGTALILTANTRGDINTLRDADDYLMDTHTHNKNPQPL